MRRHTSNRLAATALVIGLGACQRPAPEPGPTSVARPVAHEPAGAPRPAPAAEAPRPIPEPEPLPGSALETITVVLQQSDIPVIDRTARLSARSRVDLAERMRSARATGAARLWVGTSGEVDAFTFDDEATMRAFLEGCGAAIAYHRAVLVPDGALPESWSRIAAAFEARDGVHVTAPAPAEAGPDLAAIRAAVADYQRYFQMPADFPASLWSELILHEFLSEAPRNPDSPEPLATRIVAVNRPGQTGTAVSSDAAGWVWNRADRRLYLAGRAD